MHWLLPVQPPVSQVVAEFVFWFLLCLCSQCVHPWPKTKDTHPHWRCGPPSRSIPSAWRKIQLPTTRLAELYLWSGTLLLSSNSTTRCSIQRGTHERSAPQPVPQVSEPWQLTLVEKQHCFKLHVLAVSGVCINIMFSLFTFSLLSVYPFIITYSTFYI